MFEGISEQHIQYVEKRSVYLKERERVAEKAGDKSEKEVSDMDNRKINFGEMQLRFGIQS